MKALILFLAALLFLQSGRGQGKNGQDQDHYTILSAGFGEFFPFNPGHDINATFPYTVHDLSSGSTSSQTFSGTLHGKFTKPAYMIDLLNLEFVRREHGIDLGVGLFREAGGNHGFYLKGGYHYILPLGWLLIKPGIDLFYLNETNKMGDIDNKKKEIGLFGLTAKDQFTIESTDDNGYTTDNVYDADHLDVNYKLYNFLLEPKLVLAPRLKPRARFTFSLEAGWMVQLAQISNLQFEQKAGSVFGGNNVGSVGWRRSGFLTGPYMAVNVGVALWPKKAKGS